MNDLFGYGFHGFRLAQNAVEIIGYDLGNAADVGRDDRNAAGLSLEYGVWYTFVNGGEQKKVGGAQNVFYIGARS